MNFPSPYSSDISITGRKPNTLAVHYGYTDVQDFADSLRSEASVVDVGAGISMFGRAVALLRPDITWTNIDPAYEDSFIRETAENNRPGNLNIVTATANALPALYGQGAFDVTLSYWLLPHLSEEDIAQTAQQLYRITRIGGQIMLGPLIDKGHITNGHNTFTTVKTSGNVGQFVADTKQCIYRKRRLQHLEPKTIILNN